MKKIMFNDKYGLTGAVLNGTKTVTRRENKQSRAFGAFFGTLGYEKVTYIGNKCRLWDSDTTFIEFKMPYQVGEIVALAQNYRDCMTEKELNEACAQNDKSKYIELKDAGYNNKMFVKAELMPNQIRITDIRAELLKHITDEDCLKEGICDFGDYEPFVRYGLDGILKHGLADTPKEAYAELINKISGKGTWERNPFVWRIEFELVK